MFNPNDDHMLDQMVDADIDFAMESRWELENPKLPEQLELIEEEI